MEPSASFGAGGSFSLGDVVSDVSGVSGAAVSDGVGGGVSWSLGPQAAQDNIRIMETRIEMILFINFGHNPNKNVTISFQE